MPVACLPILMCGNYLDTHRGMLSRLSIVLLPTLTLVTSGIFNLLT